MTLNRLLALVVIVFCSFSASANHVLGGNISWECMGGDQYEVTFTMYKDCYGTPGDPLTETVFFFPSGCGASPFSVDISFAGSVEISDLCLTELENSSCAGGLNPGTMKVTYSGVVTLDPGCTWEIIWNNGDWNYFQNMDNFDGMGMPLDAYIHAEIDTSLPCQDSFDITSTGADPEISYFCMNTSSCHQITVSNPNGYTLNYSLGPCQTTGGSIDTPINAPGYTIPAGMTISPTGNICWPNPSALGNYAVCVEIEIYDGPDLIGTTYQNIVIVVRNCAPTTTTITTPNVYSVGGGTTATGNALDVCAGDSLIFSVQATNTNITQTILYEYTISPALPGLVLEQDSSNTPSYAHFSLLTTGGMTNNSPYTLTLIAADDACPDPSEDTAVYTINIHPNVQLTFTDTTICDGTNITLQAVGLSNNQYDWSIISGDLTPNPTDNQATQIVSPDSTTVYQVSGSNIPAQCQSSDQVTVNVALSNIFETIEGTSCGGSDGEIDIVIQGPGSGNYNINWSGTGVTDQQLFQDNLAGGNYSVTITDLVYGCAITENYVVANNPLPTATLLPATATICEGDSVQLTLTFTPNGDTFDFDIDPYPAGLDTVDVVSTYSFYVSPTTTTNYNVSLISDGDECHATVNLNANITVRPDLTGHFLAEPAEICNGTQLTLNVDYDAPFNGPYNVGYSINEGATVTVNNVADGGVLFNNTPSADVEYQIEYIAYTNAPACPNSNLDTINVGVNLLPTVTISGGTTICTDGTISLPLVFTGIEPFDINYTINGMAQPQIQNAEVGDSLFFDPTAPGTFNICITAVADSLCTNANNSNLNSCTSVLVVGYPNPVFSILDTMLCPGECSTIHLTVPGTGTFSALFSDDPDSTTIPDIAFSTQPSGVLFTYNICPDTTTVYTLESVFFETAPACSTEVDQSITVYILDSIDVVIADTVCDSVSENYQVEFTINQGVAPYNVVTSVTGGTPSPFNTTTYTSGWVDSGTSASWTFSDDNNCNTQTILVDHECPVLTDAGAMDIEEILLCGPVQVIGDFLGGLVLDGNDEQMYILCSDTTSLATIIATEIMTNNTNPHFTFNDVDLDYGVEYYIVSIAGNASGAGVNTNTLPPYIDASNAQPVTWYETPTATITALNNDSTACVGQNVTLSVNFTGTGPWAYTYLYNSSSYTGPGSPTLTDPYNFTVTAAGLYEIGSVSSGPNNLCPGTFSGSVNVIINPLPTAVWSASADTCAGIDYCFTITFTGNSPWDITVDNPTGPNTTLTDIETNYLYCVGDAGFYDIISVTDSNTCVNTADIAAVELTLNDLPTVSWTEDDAIFCEGDSVAIELLLDGLPPFALDIDSPDPGIDNPTSGVQNGDSFLVNIAGDYEINFVTDANGCVSEDGDNISVEQIDTPFVDAGEDQEQCVDGEVTIGFTPGVAGVSYEWTGDPDNDIVGSTTTSQVTVESSADGTDMYYITATTTIGGCTAVDSVEVTYYDYPVLVLTSDPDSLCADGCAELSVDGAMVYEWEEENGTILPVDTDVIQVCPDSTGFFVVTGTDNYIGVSCSTIDSIQVFVGEPLAVEEDFTEEICYGTCDGEIELEVTGGFAPYTISGDITDLNTDSLCEGIYNYTITDAIGCQLLGGSIEIIEREPEFIDEIILTNPVCDYDLGTIEVTDNTTSINVTALPCDYNLSLDGPNAVFDGLHACEYLITTIFPVGGGEFCTTDSIVEVEIISPDISLNVLWTEDIFCYQENACFEAAPSGGTGALDVEWYFDEELTQFANTDNPYCIPISQDSTLYGVAYDQLGCYSDTVMVVAEIYPDITLDLQGGVDTTYVCEYSCTDLVAEVGGGNGNVTVEWYELPFDDVVVSNDLTYEVCPIFETAYTITASDGCSQPVIDTIVVHVWDTPEVVFAVDTMEGCFPLTVTFTDLSIPIADDVTCQWGFGYGPTLGVCDTVQFTYNLPLLYAEYYPSLTITSEYGCVGTDTIDDPIIVHGYPEVDFTWEPQPVTVLEHEVQFFNLTEGAEEYLWNFYSLETSSLQDPIHDFAVVDQGVFPICLTAISEYGCADTVCQDVVMESILQVFVPNVFTADEDGINDLFLPIVTGAKPNTYRFWIFNRWGDQLFYTEDPDMAWTGNSDGGAFYVNNDTYVWRIEVEGLHDGKIEVFEGHVTILR